MTPNLDHIDTPALLLDAKKLERNCRRMRSIVHGHGVALRPHVKTAKSVEVAQVALDAPTGAITVSTLREAEYFFDHGFRDILYAVGMAPGKLRRVVDLIKRGARVSAIVDSVEAGTSIARAVASSGVRIPTLIEIDSDGHRAGVTPEDPRLLAIAEALGGSLQGVMTHAGDSYNCESTDAIKRVAERERAAVVRAAQRLREAGHRCDVVSVGSTPTATFAESLDGVTEVRTGVYMFQDLVMAGLGVCSVDEIALSVLGTVIGHQHDKGWVITDAGWMALSRDRGTARQKTDQGYGVVSGSFMPLILSRSFRFWPASVTRRSSCFASYEKEPFAVPSVRPTFASPSTLMSASCCGSRSGTVARAVISWPRNVPFAVASRRPWAPALPFTSTWRSVLSGLLRKTMCPSPR
jgi:D-serine deaminase-like pyridoxal phosphate-dependent protein